MNAPVLTVTLATALFEPALRDGGAPPVTARIEAELSALVDELGVPARPVVRLGADTAPARDHPVRVDVDRLVCRTPRMAFADAVSYVTGTPVAADPGGEVPPSGWPASPEQWALLTPAELAEPIALVCRAAVAGRPEALLPEDDPLAAVLRAGRSLAGSDPDTLRATIRADRPELPTTGPARQLELLVEPHYLKELTTSNDGAGLFSVLRENMFTELGVVLPPMHVRPDPTLRPRGFAFRVNGVRTLPRIGLSPGTIYVSDTVERLRLMDMQATATVDPTTGRRGAITDATHREVLESIGATVWDPFGYFILALAETVRERAYALVTSAFADDMLDRLGQSFPAVASSARVLLPPGVLTSTMRALLRDGVGVRNLRRIVELLLRHEQVPEEAVPDRLAFVRAGLADQIGMNIANDGAAAVYLLDPSIEEAVAAAGSGPDDDLGERLADALATELRELPPTATVPPVLADERCRPQVADHLRREFPRLRVVSFRDLPVRTLVRPIARIYW